MHRPAIHIDSEMGVLIHSFGWSLMCVRYFLSVSIVIFFYEYLAYLHGLSLDYFIFIAFNFKRIYDHSHNLTTVAQTQTPFTMQNRGSIKNLAASGHR